MDSMSTADELDIKIEELRYNSMGFDYEEDEGTESQNNKEDSLEDEKPFNPEKIRVDQQMLSVKYMLELMDEHMIELNPGFQRHRVWKDNKRKSLLIESLMLRIPIPAFYFYENEDGVYQVIDGQQRLTTIQDFVKGKFRLSGLEYLGNDYDKKGFKDLDVKYVQRIYRTQIAVNILDARSPKKVIYDIFRRVNTGGSSLNPQEMRNAICKQDVRDFLIKSINNENYLKATRKRIKDDRMDSQELTLRFYAFYESYSYDKNKINYEYPNVASMLDDEIEKLNKKDRIEREKLYAKFNEAMRRCYLAFGEFCFSKIYWDEKNNTIIRNLDYVNKSLFSSFSVLLMHPRFDNFDFKKNQEQLIEILAQKLTDNHLYSNSLTVGTGDKRNVCINFACSKEVLDKWID